MKRGMKAGSYEILSASGLHCIHAAGLSLLEDPGIFCESEAIAGIFKKGGAKVDEKSGVVFVSPDMVEKALKSAPKSFVMHGLDPEMDLLVEPGRVYYGMGGSSEPLFYDYDLGQPRKPTRADMVSCTRVGQALSNMDFIMTLCTSGDVPADQAFYHDISALCLNTTKPIVFTVLDRDYMKRVIGIVSAASGGESEFRRRPRVMGFVTPVSPLTFPRLIEGIIDTVAVGMPVLYAPGPMMSATAPTTIAGLLAQTVAELLFGLVLVQLLKPGAPVVLKMDSDVMDPQTGQCTYGSPEQILGRAALAQIGRFYSIPTFTMGGGVESKLPDAEAAAEAMMGMLVNALSGITLSQAQGTLASGMYGSLEQLVVCNEMIRMIRRLSEGFSVNEDTLALDVIRSVGHGGNFLTEDHTLRFFKEELYFPDLFRRRSIDDWLNSGGKPVIELAHERVSAILRSAGGIHLPVGAKEAVEEALEHAIGEVVKG